jgi:hypothetical protein
LIHALLSIPLLHGTLEGALCHTHTHTHAQKRTGTVRARAEGTIPSVPLLLLLLRCIISSFSRLLVRLRSSDRWFAGRTQAAAKLAKVEAAQAAQAARGGGGGGGGGGTLTKAQLQGQIKKLKKATVKAVQDGDPQRAAALKKRWSAQEPFPPCFRALSFALSLHPAKISLGCSLELMEQEKTAPDVVPRQESAELGDDGEVRDDDPMLLDVLGEIGLDGACAQEIFQSAMCTATGVSPLKQISCCLTRWQ